MDEKIVEFDQYTYSSRIPDQKIESFAQYSLDELNRIIPNPDYCSEVISGVQKYWELHSNKDYQKQEEPQMEKSKAFVKKAGFMDVGMFVDILVISVAIILLIIIILGTRY